MGSRGKNLEIKADLIRPCITHYTIETVLDIGRGDIAVVSALSIQDYVGIDISDVIVERNRRNKPEWHFIRANLVGNYVPPLADLVFCLDVLTHQKSRHAYFVVLSKVLEATKKTALISSYSHPDPGWNVFFYEPLAPALPPARVRTLSNFRDIERPLFS